MKVNDLIKSLELCIVDGNGCNDCVFFECDRSQNCQKLLFEAIRDKFSELIELVDDKVNHHYYDTLESYQEENMALNDKLDQILKILEKNT